MYTQCELKYNDKSKAVVWIFSKFAKLHKRLYDKDMKRECIVSEVYGETQISKEMLKEFERMQRNYRSVTDI